jgi:hypothetical protein
MPDQPNSPNFEEESHDAPESRPLLGRDMSPQDREVVTINLDKQDQRDDVKKTTWH